MRKMKIMTMLAVLTLAATVARADLIAPPKDPPAKAAAEVSWGQEADGLQLGISLGVRGPASLANTKIVGLVVNRSSEPKKLSAFTLGSNILSLKVFQNQEGGEPLPTVPPPLPPAHPKDHELEHRPGGLFRFPYDLNMFSPELKPGTYWVEFRCGRAVSPRVKVEVIPTVPAPDEASARKQAASWALANGKDDWGEITKTEDRGEHWLVLFTKVMLQGSPAQHTAGVYIYKKSGKIQEAIGR